MSLTINHQTNDISATSGSVTLDGSAVGGGSWSLVSTTTVSSSASAVNFTGLSGETYYKIIAKGVKGSSGVANVYLRVSRNSSIKSDAAYKTFKEIYTPGSSSTSVSSASGDTQFWVGRAPSATGGGGQMEVFIYDTDAKRVTQTSTGIYNDSNGNGVVDIRYGHDYTDTSNTLDGLSFFLSSGTIEEGTFSLYSLVTS